MNMNLLLRVQNKMFCGDGRESSSSVHFWLECAVLRHFLRFLAFFFIIIYFFLYEEVNIYEEIGKSMRQFALY